MGYSDKAGMVRVDFFKESGKWKYTEAVDMDDYYNDDCIHDAFLKALKQHFKGKPRFLGLRAVCLEPYHYNAHPISLLIGAHLFRGGYPE